VNHDATLLPARFLAMVTEIIEIHPIDHRVPPAGSRHLASRPATHGLQQA